MVLIVMNESVGGRNVTLDEWKPILKYLKKTISMLYAHHIILTKFLGMVCDEAGIYMMAETNLESHGSWQKWVQLNHLIISWFNTRVVRCCFGLQKSNLNNLESSIYFALARK